MLTLSPLTGHRVATDHAASVVAPPYDALTPAQREALAVADPDSFLNVLPRGGSEAVTLDVRLQACRGALERLLDEGRFVEFPGPCLAVIAIGEGTGRTVGIVGDVEVGAFEDGRILPHEQVQPARVANLARYLDVVGVASTPVCVTHRPHPAAADATAPLLERPPEVAFQDEGTDVALWLIRDPQEQAALRDAVAVLDRLYVADGHHRAAAMARHARSLDGGVRPVADAAGAPVLTAVVPADHLRVLPFHRLVTAPDLRADDLVDRLTDAGLAVEPLPAPAAPDVPGTFHVTVEGRWWRADASGRRRSGPVEGLDVRLAAQTLLAPLLGTDDVDHDPRVAPVAPTRGLDSLVAPGHLGVALCPPSIDAVLEVADAGASMPSKTTYVAPKLRSGLLLTPR